MEKVYTNRHLLVCDCNIINGRHVARLVGQQDFTTSLCVLRSCFESIIGKDKGNTKQVLPVPLGCFSTLPASDKSLASIVLPYLSTDLSIENYSIRLVCSKKVAKLSEKVVRKHGPHQRHRKKREKRTTVASDSEDSSLDLNDDGFDPDKEFELFKQNLSDLAEEAEKAGRRAFRGNADEDDDDDDDDILALSMTEVSHIHANEFVDQEQDTQDAVGLDLDSGNLDQDHGIFAHAGGEPSSSSSVQQDMKLLSDIEAKRLREAVRSNKLDLSSNNNVKEAIEKFQQEGMSLEDATLEAALNSAEVMGNISSQVRGDLV